MEEKEGINSSGVAVKGDEAPESYRVEPRNDNPHQISGSMAPVPAPVQALVVTPATPVSMAMPSSEMKKKRGRPRKYAPDGSVTTALCPMPISASIPLTGEYSAWKNNTPRPMESFKKKHKLEFESPGDRVAYTVGANFTPHIITVNPGEDVTMKIISFAQQGSRAICVLAANGAISNVTLRQPNSSGGTLTYEGRFEILSLTGSFMPSDNGLTKSRSGGMSVSLAGPDGRVLGGGMAGMLVAAGPVQVVVGSFLPGHQQEQKPKKQRYEHTASFTHLSPAPRIPEEKNEGGLGSKPQMSSPTSLDGDNVTSINFADGGKISTPGIITSFAGSDSTEQSPSRCELSC